MSYMRSKCLQSPPTYFCPLLSTFLSCNFFFFLFGFLFCFILPNGDRVNVIFGFFFFVFSFCVIFFFFFAVLYTIYTTTTTTTTSTTTTTTTTTHILANRFKFFSKSLVEVEIKETEAFLLTKHIFIKKTKGLLEQKGKNFEQTPSN